MAKYEAFSYIYDQLMADVPYEKWAEFIEEVLVKYGKKTSFVCDLGCGTGTLTLELSQKGYDMIGIDLSSEMLMMARDKWMERIDFLEDRQEQMGALKSVMFLCQDMRELDLYGAADAFIASCDAMNYIPSIKDISLIFKRISQYMEEGGIFIFDMNTPYRFEEIYGQNTFTYKDETVAYIWENQYDSKTKINTYDVTFFVEDQENGYYERFEEQHQEYAYGQEEIETALKEAGLKLVSLCDEYTWKPIDRMTERWTWIVRKESEENESII